MQKLEEGEQTGENHFGLAFTYAWLAAIETKFWPWNTVRILC